MFLSADSVCARMNASALRKEPFLCAFDYAGQRGIFFTQKALERRQDIAFRTPRASYLPQAVRTAAATPLPAAALAKFPASYVAYEKSFARVRAALLRGDTYLANLTARTRVATALSFESIFAHSNTPYGLWVKDTFVCFSPESFVRIAEDGTICAFPMKGTAPADSPQALARLLADEKERCEQHTIVDLIRNDLNQVADGVCVPRFRYAEKCARNDGADLWQISSEVRGQLRDGLLGDVVCALLPAGSVSGAPKVKTVAVLAEAEACARGFYTGIFGWFDGQSFDSAVLIRFMEKSGDALFYRSGGGITAQSVCTDEYAELLSKIYLPLPGKTL